MSEPSRRYDDLSRETLISLLERRDARRAYGLVWERESISPDAAVNDDFVVLDVHESLSTARPDGAGWRNLVIEGDNWDALRALRLTCAGRVKTILIDPPYNTGNQNFVYNDRFVGPQDRYRQSIWLEFLKAGQGYSPCPSKAGRIACALAVSMTLDCLNPRRAMPRV